MDEIREKIEKAIKKLFGVAIKAEVVPSPENIAAELGTDYSSNVALKLAKDLHRAPLDIANEIASEMTSESASGMVAEPDNKFAPEPENEIISVSKPGFLNFQVPDQILVKKVTKLTEEFLENISQDEYSGQTIICEFSDPNPFKVLHVGHLYTSVVGDAISRLFETAGGKVIRANFGGDVGLHVGKTIYALCAPFRENPALTTEELLEKDTTTLGEKAKELIENLTIEQIAKCYVEGTLAYDEDEKAKAEIVKLNKAIYQINEQNLHGTLVADLYWRGRELSYDYFKAFYARIGLKFDRFYPESEVAALGLSKVLEEEKAGIYEKSAGAIIFDGEKFGLHTRVFVNKEGVPTYEAKDVGLIFKKWSDYHFDKSVVITGNEQLEYMKVVLKSVEQYAPELVEKTSHLTHGLVKLPGNVKMSSRKGNFLKAVDVLDLVAHELEEERGAANAKIVLAATKYAFLKYKMGGNIVFDPKESVKMTGNSGPYLLYSAVRARKILEKVMRGEDAENIFSEGLSRFARPETSIPDGPDRFVSEGDGSAGVPVYDVEGEQVPFGKDIFASSHLVFSERELIKKLLQYKDVLSEATSEMAPHKLANYLYETAQEFSRFYENCPVKGSENEEFRVKLVTAFTEVIYHGMNILGIEIPEEM